MISIYPSDDEIATLQRNIERLGTKSFKQALEELDCGNVEEFILELLLRKRNFKYKASILSSIMEISPSINALIASISDWVAIKDDIIDNQLLKHVIKITTCMLAQVNETQKPGGFDLKTLPELFDVKSTHSKDKCAYHFVMKMYLLHGGMGGLQGQRLLESG